MDIRGEDIVAAIGVFMAGICIIIFISMLGSCGRQMDESSVIKACLAAGNPVAQCMGMYEEGQGE